MTMHGVIVRGMEVPPGCPMCPLSHWNWANEFTGCEITPGKKFAVYHDPEYANSPSKSRPDWCPLEPAPEWISVEERLPESGEHVLACCFVKWLGGGGKSYVCDAYYAKPKTLTCNSCGDDIAYEYDEETDEYYLLEGWYEVIKNWGDYDSISIGDFVTHWMPLPKPPKEEDK